MQPASPYGPLCELPAKVTATELNQLTRGKLLSPDAYAPLRAHLGLAVDEWDALFHTVEARLEVTVSEVFMALPSSLTVDTTARVQLAVLECVDALRKLHKDLVVKRGIPEIEGFEVAVQLLLWPATPRLVSSALTPNINIKSFSSVPGAQI